MYEYVCMLRTVSWKEYKCQEKYIVYLVRTEYMRGYMRISPLTTELHIKRLLLDGLIMNKFDCLTTRCMLNIEL